jgi:GTP-binding protein EngB required for normal cell division
MNQSLKPIVETLGSLIRRFQLDSLALAVQACEALSATDAFLDVAVIGQFKSGKSSLLNALLGANIFPVSALPATAVITRTLAGPSHVVRVHHLDGTTTEIAPEQIAEFVTEAGNPRNRRRVAVVDVLTPVMLPWPGVRLVDTPGLGSVFLHNTEVTRQWMPHVVVALVTMSADRPLSEDDCQLIAEAQKVAGRVIVVLTKVDLLNHDELPAMIAYIAQTTREKLGIDLPILPFSARSEQARWLRLFQDTVLTPVIRDSEKERQSALMVKIAAIANACRDYLTVGLQAAERAEAERRALQNAVLDESVKIEVIRDELHMVEQSIQASTRSAFESQFFQHQARLIKELVEALREEVTQWKGGLAQQAEHYEQWMKESFQAELTPLSQDGIAVATDLMKRAEDRFQRVVGAFRDRITRNIRQATGLTVSTTTWTVDLPVVRAIPVAVSHPFMMSWGMLSWLLPMWLVGGIFRRHLIQRVPWEVEKNLTRLVSDWSNAVNAAVRQLYQQAEAWVNSELTTLHRLLSQSPVEVSNYREALLTVTDLIRAMPSRETSAPVPNRSD